MLVKPCLAWHRQRQCDLAANFAAFALMLILAVLAGCASKPYQHDPGLLLDIIRRAEMKQQGKVQVRVSVPGPEETKAFFGIPLYDSQLQPVWIEVINRGDTELRFAPVGTDPLYVPPSEVAYTHRSGFSREARSEIELYLHQLAMPRRIEAGKTGSGFVFTQARPGTKGVNIDLFGPEKDDVYSFIFFVPVPGFTADHTQVDFDTLYAENDRSSYDENGLRQALQEMPCCASGPKGEDLLNVVFIGDGNYVLQALLKAGWYERPARDRARVDASSNASRLYGRIADAVFHKEVANTTGVGELRLWLTPMKLGAEPVWVGDVIRFINGPDGAVALDPDMDDARNFIMQDIWYAQSLARLGWLKMLPPVPFEEPRIDALGNEYFTDGMRVVLWPSRVPVSLLEVEYAEWDDPLAKPAGDGNDSADQPGALP